MSYNFYSILHLSSIVALSLVLGALWGLYANPQAHTKFRSFFLALRGLLMFLIFFAGFGLIAKIKLSFPWPFWIYIKLMIWCLIGASPFFIKKASRKKPSPKKYLAVLFYLFALMFLAVLAVRLR